MHLCVHMHRYNLDVFEYELTDDYMYQPLYGAVPFMQAMDKSKTTVSLPIQIGRSKSKLTSPEFYLTPKR